jgi:hypothetical protein
MPKQNISLDRLREVLRYNPETGRFTWVRPASNRVRPGASAGTPSGQGYIKISIDGVSYYAHRLAWMWLHGAMPESQIDHRDGDRSNNKAVNLRAALHCENGQNQGLRSTNKSGFHGVSWSAKHGKWATCIHVGGKKQHIGLFADPAEGSLAYLAAKVVAHPFQPIPRDVKAA